MWSNCVQFSDDEGTGWCHRNFISAEVPGGLGLCAQSHQVANTFLLVVFSLVFLQNNSGNLHLLLQYSCLENPRDGGALWAAVHGVDKSQAWLSGFSFTFYFHAIGEENGNPLQGESQGWGSLVGCRPWGGTESDTTEATYNPRSQTDIIISLHTKVQLWFFFKFYNAVCFTLNYKISLDTE